ncbi:MAG TPA: gamma-glutamyl-gamma-aminobutyrate hydrolase family protein [Armatimonadota bacterium]|mgnify:CR=1 FL=1|nr:gamma-glutamyl-gamma-aminobutyrate hydrolase family protein [Armatimonadota bacterium]
MLQKNIPIIGITTGTTDDWRYRGESYLSYARAITRAGGCPVAIGHRRKGRIEDCTGLLVTGGKDVHPRHYERRPGDEGLSFDELKAKYSLLWDEIRDGYELPLVARALETGIPILGICRGLQLINIILGKRLIPDIPACIGNSIIHSNHKDATVFHKVEIDSESRIGRMLGRQNMEINSYHHQGISSKELAPGLKAVGTAPDGIIEAVEGISHPWLIAVQWHPERSKDKAVSETCLPLFEEFVKTAKRYHASER